MSEAHTKVDVIFAQPFGGGETGFFSFEQLSEQLYEPLCLP